MRILALTVGYNEEDRYLKKMLQHLHSQVDGQFFYDDRSTDKTPNIAANYGPVVIRPSIAPSFLENEGAFRESAWMEFEHHMNPELGDWVLVIDCDEFLISKEPLMNVIWDEVMLSSVAPYIGFDLAIKEVFGLSQNGRPLVRVDRLWSTIHAPRLFSYEPHANYFHGEFGVPAVPQYVMRGPWQSTESCFLAHFGYAALRDRLAKYMRYNGRLGHSDAHVQSINDPHQILVQQDDWKVEL
jgi:glycosyltransferase involved in cell wall biosynthesis